MTVFNELTQSNKVLGLQSRFLREELSEPEKRTYEKIVSYLETYCSFYSLKAADLIKVHEKFVAKYNQDLKNFKETKKFPFELKTNTFEITRMEYDLSLLLSTVLVPHRFKIMDLIARSEGLKKNTLIIGVGSGLELSLLKGGSEVEAYDLALSDFVKRQFEGKKEIHLRDQAFESKKASKTYGNVFLIEILEHVEDPYGFLSDILKSCEKGARVFLTTIKNVPQFDHLFNFSNEDEFEQKIKSMKLQIKEKTVLKHDYFAMDIDANNIFYSLIYS